MRSREGLRLRSATYSHRTRYKRAEGLDDMARSAKRTGSESSGVQTHASIGLVGGRQEFARFEGNAELEEALMHICGQSPERKIKGAGTIMMLMSKEPIDPKLAERAFDPLLTLAESERDKAVKRSFIKALG